MSFRDSIALALTSAAAIVHEWLTQREYADESFHVAFHNPFLRVWRWLTRGR